MATAGAVPRGTRNQVLGHAACIRCGTRVGGLATSGMCVSCDLLMARAAALGGQCALCGTASPPAVLGAGGFCPACYLQTTGQQNAGGGLTVTPLTHPACHACKAAPAIGNYAGVRLCGNCATILAPIFNTKIPTMTMVAASEPLPRDFMPVPMDLIGWRIWRVTGSGYLRSLTAEVIWLPGEPMEATEVTDHGAASNGIHVFMDRAAALKEMTSYLEPHVRAGTSFALGSVLLWGDVVEHERGYRAERAKILSIDDVVWDGKPPWDGETRKALAFLREQYLPTPPPEKE